MIVLCLYKKIKENLTQNLKRVILRDRKMQYTGHDLLEKANQYANYLNEKGIQDEEVVCIISDNSCEVVACVLGILQVYGAYLPLSPDIPIYQRLSILQDVSPRFIFVQEGISVDGFTCVSFKEINDGNPAKALPCRRKPNQLAYLAYTSGSTGRPKGVMVEDSNIMSYCKSFNQIFNVTNEDIMLQASVISFDGFTEEIFVPLLYGASIFIPEKHETKHPVLICDLIKKFGITLYASTPLMINELNKLEHVPSIRVLISAGDVLKNSYYSNIIKHIDVFNMYGPTETTVTVTYHPCSEQDPYYPSIGKALPNSVIYILDENGEPVKKGEKGEIYIGGGGVARGYWNDSELTQQHFITWNNERVYRSGDYGYANDDGNFYLIGRIDRQVKIRGFRIELEEIELIASKFEGVQNAIALILQNNDEKIIALAYVAHKKCEEIEYFKFLYKFLPEYMIPHYFLQVDNIPLNAIGKIDYAYLSETVEIATQEKTVIQKDSYTNTLSDINIKGRVLNVIASHFVGKTSLEVSFDMSFDILGIDSITFIKMVIMLEEEFEFEFDDEMLIFTKFPTVMSMISYIESKIKVEVDGQ